MCVCVEENCNLDADRSWRVLGTLHLQSPDFKLRCLTQLSLYLVQVQQTQFPSFFWFLLQIRFQIVIFAVVGQTEQLIIIRKSISALNNVLNVVCMWKTSVQNCKHHFQATCNCHVSRWAVWTVREWHWDPRLLSCKVWLRRRDKNQQRWHSAACSSDQLLVRNFLHCYY